VAPVAEQVQVHLVQVLPTYPFNQSFQMTEVAMHAPVGKEPHEVEAAGTAGRFGQGLEAGELEEGALTDGFVDAGKILPDNAAGADIQVADLRIAELALG